MAYPFTKTVGEYKIVAFTDGHPTCVVITDLTSDINPVGRTTIRTSKEGLYDLRYAIDRVLTFLESRNIK